MEMKEVVLDAIIDSSKVFLAAVIILGLIALVEEKIVGFLTKYRKSQVVVATACGLLPQCGISVVAADLYRQKRISVGALLAIFFACSDEALPILLTSSKTLPYVLILILIKLVFGIILGYCLDFYYRSKDSEIIQANDIPQEDVKHRLLHALEHSIKIFIYVLIINLILGVVMHYVGDKLTSFWEVNVYWTPLLSVAVGMIPNCASSAILCELFMLNHLPFGALVAGLCVNAGLGFLILLKDKSLRLQTLKFLGILASYSLLVGYLVLIIMQML